MKFHRVLADVKTVGDRSITAPGRQVLEDLEHLSSQGLQG